MTTIEDDMRLRAVQLRALRFALEATASALQAALEQLYRPGTPVRWQKAGKSGVGEVARVLAGRLEVQDATGRLTVITTEDIEEAELTFDDGRADVNHIVVDFRKPKGT